jgi:flavorubredoxin
MISIAKNINYIGVIDWHRRLFDSLIPLPDGTSYNSYVVKGSEKVAIIDTAEPLYVKEWLTNLKAAHSGPVDYIIANHAEQDHSGSLVSIVTLHPQAKIVCTAKCRDMLVDLLHLAPEHFLVVEDKQTISLGDKTLEFIVAPWVHWPETMFTYVQEDQLLFSCDFLGSHYSSNELFVQDEAVIYEAAKRYYAEIMSPFRTHIQKHLQNLNNYKIKIIAPSHGQVYAHPEFILKAYQDWSSDKLSNKVIIAYVSMHESTKIMADHLLAKLTEHNIPVRFFELTTTDIGKLAMELVDAATVIIGSPTVLGGAHPAAANAVFLANALRPKTKYVSIIGSYSWGGKMVEQLAGLITNFKPEILTPVMAKGLPRAADLAALDVLAQTIVDKHKTL